MTTRPRWFALAVLAVAPIARADDPAKTKAVIAGPNDLKWADAPPDLPKGGQLAVLHGDPFKAGTYTMRFKMPGGYKIPPHWHTQDEELTVLSGQLELHMGDTMQADPHTLDVGAYHFLPGKMHHAAEARGETIVQISGKGPFDIHYLDPTDNPNPKRASK
jgi:quercetin dioxygenase-like cupin family protein